VSKLASRAGYHVEIDNSCDDWDYKRASDYLVERVCGLRSKYARVCVLSGGEVSVKVPLSPGVGGRNQHFALCTALSLAHIQPYIGILSAGSDGIDGNSSAAGAIADSLTIARAHKLGLDPVEALARFDSHSLFHTLGDAIITGLTGNNVRDIRILLSA
jgi:hydroxypyruvate reductase